MPPKVITYRNGYQITFHPCGAQSYYRARNSIGTVYTRKSLSSLLSFVATK